MNDLPAKFGNDARTISVVRTRTGICYCIVDGAWNRKGLSGGEGRLGLGIEDAALLWTQQVVVAVRIGGDINVVTPTKTYKTVNACGPGPLSDANDMVFAF